MASVLHVAGRGGASRNTNLTTYWCLGDSQGEEGSTSPTEANMQSKIRSAGTFSNFAIIVKTNTASTTATFKSRLNSADGAMAKSVLTTQTGEFADTVNSDAVVATDLYCFQQVIPTGSGAMAVSAMAVQFAATTNTVKRLTDEGVSFSVQNQTSFISLTGSATSGIAEANVQLVSRTAGTLKNLFCWVNVNSRTTPTTLGSRVNGANGNLLLSIPSTTSGLFEEDTVNSDAVNAGDKLCLVAITGNDAAHALGLRAFGCEFVTTNNSFLLANTTTVTTAPTVAAAATAFWPVGGDCSSSKTATETDCKLTSRLGFTASNLGTNITANTITGNSTVALRVNGAASVLTKSITGNTTGFYEDLVDSVSLLTTDKINYTIIGGAGGTSLSVTGIWMVGTIPTAYVLSGQGGILSGGLSSPAWSMVHAPSGGALAGSQADEPVTYVIAPQGGSLTGSQASPAATIVPVPQGGSLVGSQTGLAATASPSPSGGALLGSQAGTGAQSLTVLATGGLLAGSQSTPAWVSALAPLGGALVGSQVSQAATATPAPQGGGLIGSQADALKVLSYGGSGGSLIGSTSATVSAYNPSGQGGAILGSQADAVQASPPPLPPIQVSGPGVSFTVSYGSSWM